MYSNYSSFFVDSTDQQHRALRCLASKKARGWRKCACIPKVSCDWGTQVPHKVLASLPIPSPPNRNPSVPPRCFELFHRVRSSCVPCGALSSGEQHFAQEMFLLVQSRWEEDERTRRQRQEEQQRAEQQAAEQLRKAEEAWRRQEAQKAKEEAGRCRDQDRWRWRRSNKFPEKRQYILSRTEGFEGFDGICESGFFSQGSFSQDRVFIF